MDTVQICSLLLGAPPLRPRRVGKGGYWSATYRYVSSAHYAEVHVVAGRHHDFDYDCLRTCKGYKCGVKRGGLCVKLRPLAWPVPLKISTARCAKKSSRELLRTPLCFSEISLLVHNWHDCIIVCAACPCPSSGRVLTKTSAKVSLEAAKQRRRLLLSAITEPPLSAAVVVIRRAGLLQRCCIPRLPGSTGGDAACDSAPIN